MPAYSVCVLSLLLSLPFLATCAHTQPPPEFSEREDRGVVINDAINEASGLAASRTQPGVLWTHNDSGDTTRIFAVGTGGENLGEFYPEGTSATDWEDIALGPGPTEGINYIFVGEIGDNFALRETKTIYRFPEPKVERNGTPGMTSVRGVEAITLRYPDGARDAEALMIDPQTRDIYIVSKREDAVRVYRAPYPQSTTGTTTLEHVATLDSLTLITAGDISADGGEIILKNYLAVYYWHRKPGESVGEAMSRRPTLLPYTPEPQGEAITWDRGGYWTLSEEFQNVPARLYFYPRKKAATIDQGKEPEGSLQLRKSPDLSGVRIGEGLIAERQ